MPSETRSPRLAVLIDARKWRRSGRPASVVSVAIFSGTRSKGWADVLARQAIIPQQQRAYLRDLMRANGASGRKVS
jgi:hypothetical protein